MQNNQLSHFNASGDAHMVDISDKDISIRKAIASGYIYLSDLAFAKLDNPAENKKGDVLAVARLAAIMATKQTANLIPLCHPIALTHVDVEFIKNIQTKCVQIKVTTQTTGKTGVEMEALIGVTNGLLTIYDMLKAVDKNMLIQDVKLIYKQGGKSGIYQV